MTFQAFRITDNFRHLFHNAPWPLKAVSFDYTDRNAVHAAVPVHELVPDPGEVRAVEAHERHQRQRGRRQA